MADDREMRDEARRKMLEACQDWVDNWAGSEQGVVTGFVVIMETSVTNMESRPLTWATGGPMAEGLSSHQVLGMIEDVKHELLAYTLKVRNAPE